MELDPEDKDRQTLLFNYPRTSGWGENWGASWGGEEGAGYIKPRIKLEYGARGEPEPFEDRAIVPYLAEAFPDELPNASTLVPTLSILRTYWEKATILHSLHHKGKLRAGLSRHYYDLLMLDRAAVTDEARAHPELLAAVVRNKSLMFADKAASYDTAVLGQLRLSPTEAMLQELASDYAAMADMFMIAPPGLNEMLDGIADLEKRLNGCRGHGDGCLIRFPARIESSRHGRSRVRRTCPKFVVVFRTAKLGARSLGTRSRCPLEMIRIDISECESCRLIRKNRQIRGRPHGHVGGGVV